MNTEQARKQERDAIVAWLRQPMARDWKIKPWPERIWFAWHIMRGHFGVFDGVRLHASNQLERGQHLEGQA